MIIMSTSEEWVKIYVDDGSLYYWNRRTQETENKEVQTSWAGKKDTRLILLPAIPCAMRSLPAPLKH